MLRICHVRLAYVIVLFAHRSKRRRLLQVSMSDYRFLLTGGTAMEEGKRHRGKIGKSCVKLLAVPDSIQQIPAKALLLRLL